MVFMFYLSLLPRSSLKFIGLFVSHATNLLVSKNKIVCTSRRSLAQCQACLLGKSSRLSLRPTSHKTTTPLDLIFSDVWALTSMFSSAGFHYFVIFIDAYTKHIWYSFCCKIRCVFYISSLSNTC